MRKTDEQKKAALQQRIAALREKVQRIERRENEQARRDRTHVGIVIGWGMIEHALAHPHSEVQRVALRLIEAPRFFARGHAPEFPNLNFPKRLLRPVTAR